MIDLGYAVIEPVTGAAATEDVDLRPPVGSVWLVEEIALYHDDPAAIEVDTILYDGVTEMRVGTFTNVAQYSYRWLRNANTTGSGMQFPLYLTRSNYFRASYLSIAAGKKGYILARVQKFRGLPADA